jgi:diguanylate cyclase (GGDEF)-like protein/PAS domain S-box-containing protein
MRDLIVTSLLFSAFIQLLLVAYAWTRRRVPGAAALIFLGLTCFAWAFTYGMDLASNDLQVKILWMQIRFSFTVFTSLAVLLFALDYLGRRSWLTRRRLAALLIVPLLALCLNWSVAYHQLFRYNFAILQVGTLPILTWESGPAYWLVLFYTYLLAAASIYLLLRSLQNTTLIQRRQTLAAVVALAIPLLVDTLYNFGISPVPRFNFTPQILILSWLLLAYAIFRYRLLDLAPLARSKLVDMLPSGVFALDAQERLIDINPTAQRVLGVTSAAIGQPARQAFAHLPADLLARIDPQAESQEIRVQQANGASAYYDIQSIPLSSEGGRLSGRLFMFHNISERKQEELHLLQLTQAVEQSPTSIVITDLDGRIEYANPQFSALTGYSLEEVLGLKTSLVKSGQTPPQVYRQMWQAIQSGQTWRGEFLNRKKNGELYWELAVIAPIKDQEGRLINFIAIKENITEQKAAQEALHRSEAELRLANARLEEKIAEISALQAELRQQATLDPLTGLHNRRSLGEFLPREMALAQRRRSPLSVMLIDIDHFKEINDQFGHHAGDEFLKMLADQLVEQTRVSDMVCRYGGEEFLLVFPGVALETAQRRAEEIRQKFAKTVLHFAQAEIHTTISVGVAGYPDHAQSADELLNKADAALYQSKRNGRNRVELADR